MNLTEWIIKEDLSIKEFAEEFVKVVKENFSAHNYKCVTDIINNSLSEECKCFNHIQMDKIELAKWLHDNYEEVAKEQNWNTQENCKVEFEALPDANKQTMIKLAGRLLNCDLLHLHIVS